LLGKAIQKFGRDKFIICTKFAVQSDNQTVTGISGKAEYVAKACEDSLKRLSVEYSDLYDQHRVDPATPIEETVGAMSLLVKQGKVKYLGLSECSAATLRRAYAVHPISAVQIEYNMWTPDLEDTLFPTCRELGVGIVAYSPVGRGLLTGAIKKPEDLSADDWRRGNPRFVGENFTRNLELVAEVQKLAASKNCTSSQLALAWVMRQGNDIVPIPGTKRKTFLLENNDSFKVKITDEEERHIRGIMKNVLGERYPPQMMALLNQ